MTLKVKQVCSTSTFSHLKLFWSTIDNELLEIAKNKTRVASWLVSNCDSQPSNRSELVKRLQENGVEVLIYGKCGTEKCEGNDCWSEAVQAKFYLAFENSLCTDYVTEKLYKTADENIVPVVFSGGE